MSRASLSKLEVDLAEVVKEALGGSYPLFDANDARTIVWGLTEAGREFYRLAVEFLRPVQAD